jgi:hypothetical protein
MAMPFVGAGQQVMSGEHICHGNNKFRENGATQYR